MNQIDMLGLFKSLQEEMRAKLELGRAMIPHNGEMGAAAEDSWREWLRKYLPKRYKVDKAFVVDSNGNCSDQIDIVIYDSQYSYFLFNHEQVLYIPAESVYAVIECKQTLNKQNLHYAGEKAASVRALYRTSNNIPFATGVYNPKPLHTILAGIIVIESEWKDPLGDTFKSNMKLLSEDCRLDFGCAIKQGSFWAEWDPSLSIKKSAKDEALLFFFLQLLMKLQMIGTVPAIDIGKYAKVLQSFET